MFSRIVLRDDVQLLPNQIGSNINNRIIESLKKSFEKKILGRINSYIIAISDVNEDSIKNGTINDINGGINYNLEYTAVIFRPMKNHILDVTINNCNDLGIWGFATLLPDVTFIECICPKHLLKGYTFSEESSQWIKNEPEDEKESKQKKKNKKKQLDIVSLNSKVQIKILNFQIETTKISIIGSIV
jgi:DNA-directed RNA polymerase II subunit RPB7